MRVARSVTAGASVSGGSPLPCPVRPLPASRRAGVAVSATGHNAARLARAVDQAEPLTFLRHLPSEDVYRRGPEKGGALIVMPGIWSGMPPRLLAAMRARRGCAATGRCSACGECVKVATGEFPHEPDCPVPDDRLAPLLRQWVRKAGPHGRGRRLREDPA